MATKSPWGNGHSDLYSLQVRSKMLNDRDSKISKEFELKQQRAPKTSLDYLLTQHSLSSETGRLEVILDLLDKIRDKKVQEEPQILAFIAESLTDIENSMNEAYTEMMRLPKYG